MKRLHALMDWLVNGIVKVIPAPDLSLSHAMLGCNIIKIDARGCMASDYRIDAIGVVVQVMPGQSRGVTIARCVDPQLTYKEFIVIVERCWLRQPGLYVEIV